MKKYLLIIAFAMVFGNAIAQTDEDVPSATSGTLSGLSVPVSPAFSLTDITPTLVQNPTTPKSFALGVVQSATGNNSYFPDNFSAQFAPVWWIDPKGISIYSYLGLPKPNAGAAKGQNIFSGLKFATLSVGFINKDLIPDAEEASQKIFSIGLHATVIKVHEKKYVDSLNRAIERWHNHALADLNSPDNVDLQTEIGRLDPTASDFQQKLDELTKNFKVTKSLDDLKEINTLLNQKPVFAWGLSAATAGYGVTSESVTNGRSGVWTDIALNLSLNKDKTNYFTINAVGRYLYDRYQADVAGVIGRADNFDAGGNLGFEFNRLNIAVESLYRFTNGVADTKNRTVGIISVKVAENIFLNGTFGKDFSGPNKLISLFGLNWGFGKEKVALPTN